MRYVFLIILPAVFLISPIYKKLSGVPIGVYLVDLFLNYTGISGKMNDANKGMDAFLRQLNDKKEDLDYLQNQIDNLTQGLKEMPDKNENGYFRDLLAEFKDKELILKQQLAQMDRTYQENYPNPSSQEALQVSGKTAPDQETLQDRMERMNDLMEVNQRRAMDQMELMNDLMEQNQIRMESLIERTNDLIEQNQMRPQNYEQSHQLYPS